MGLVQFDLCGAIKIISDGFQFIWIKKACWRTGSYNIKPQSADERYENRWRHFTIYIFRIERCSDVTLLRLSMFQSGSIHKRLCLSSKRLCKYSCYVKASLNFSFSLERDKVASSHHLSSPSPWLDHVTKTTAHKLGDVQQSLKICLTDKLCE